jgi:hypothetical protein
MSTKPELSGPERDAEIERLSKKFREPEPGDRVRLRVSDPASGRASTFRLKPDDAKNLDTLMRACGMTTRAVPDRVPRRRSR